MAHFNLVKQYPQPVSVGTGSLDIDRHGDASFFEGDAGRGAKLLATLQRTRIIWAAAVGILLSGFEENGYAEDGRPNYVYQEWLLRYLENT